MTLDLKLKLDLVLTSMLQVRPPIRIKKFLPKSSLQTLFSIQRKQMTEEQTKEYHLKKLSELSLKSLGEIPRLEELTEEQRQWIEGRMRGSAKSWEVWDQK
jgi:hypothetical protein